MNPTTFKYGLHVSGPVHTARQPVIWDALFAAATVVEPPFNPDAEGYLSAFRFDQAMLTHLKGKAGSSAGFAGPVWSGVLWFDLDRDDLDLALAGGRRLVTVLLGRYPKFEEDEFPLFFSGKKGVHV